MSNQRRAGIVLGYANIVVKNLVNLVYTPMLLSFVGQADYGVFQSCNSFVFSLTLLSFGFSQAYVRFYMQRKAYGDEEGIQRLNGVYLALYTVVSIVALAFGLAFAANAGAVFASGFTPEQIDTAEAVIAILSCSIAVTLFNSVFDAHIMAHERFRFQQSRQLATSLMTPFLAYVLLLAGMGVVGVAFANLVVALVLLALNSAFCVRSLRMRFAIRHFDAPLFKAIAAFSSWIFLNQVCDLVNQNVPNVLLGVLSGASAVAVFAVSIQIRNVFMSLSTTISNVFIPEINRIVAESDDNAELARLMARVGRYQMILFCWIYGGFALLGEFFMEKWAGAGFSDAYWLVLLMTLPLAIPLTQNTGIEIQRAKNMHHARSVAMFLAAAGNVAITVCLAPSIGYWAPATGYVASIALCNGVFMNWYYQRRVGLDMLAFWRRCLPVVACCAVATAACLAGACFLPVADWVSFAAWGAVYSILFAAVLWIVVLDRSEKTRISARIPFLR